MNQGNVQIDLDGYSHDIMRTPPSMGQGAIFVQIGQSEDHQGTPDRHTDAGNHLGERSTRSFSRILRQYNWQERLQKRQFPLYLRGDNILSGDSDTAEAIPNVLQGPWTILEAKEKSAPTDGLENVVDSFVLRFSPHEWTEYSANRPQGYPEILSRYGVKARRDEAYFLFEVSSTKDLSRGREIAEKFSIPNRAISLMPVGKTGAEYEKNFQKAKREVLDENYNLVYNGRHPFRDEGKDQQDKEEDGEAASEGEDTGGDSSDSS